MADVPRGPRKAPGGVIYHVLNRAVGRQTLFHDNADYAAFEKVLTEATEKYAMRLLGWCVMPNHWHLVTWPREDGELSSFMRWLCTAHVRRWHQHRHTSGEGHLYQGRFKSFPIEAEGLSTGAHLVAVCRYVERNPLRANLVERAESWRWSSLQRRAGMSAPPPLEPLPVDAPAGEDWVRFVNEPQTERELEELRASVARGRPYGRAAWQARMAEALALQFTFHRRGPVPKAEPVQ